MVIISGDNIFDYGSASVIVGMLVAIAIFVTLCLFASHDIKPYLSTDSSNFVPEYSVKMERKWGGDRDLLKMTDFNQAQELYFRLLKESK